jgi:uncharacterized surface protein with fasciclin (FAS1) repeats
MIRPAFPAAALAMLGTVACADSPTAPSDIGVEAARAPAPTTTSIAGLADGAGFSELIGALAYVDAELDAGLVETFSDGDRQFTVFAPNNAAFDDLYGLLSAVLNADIDEVTDLPAEVVLDVLLYHVAPGRRAANSVAPNRGERQMMPLLGEKFYVRGDLTIRDGLTGLRDDASILQPDLSASNGIVHEVSAVLVPPSVVAALTS